ncbi:MAG: hypothetical protein HYY37_00580 [Candidatus Aenigmarchaeota archaeon]|nr:hypothetical protein [Candidatus Aenigmarchaeota archaeon]
MEDDEKEGRKKDNGSFWSGGSFTQTMDSREMKEKMKTFHTKHDEDLHFSCKACNAKISAHNKDWHDGMCDGCFDKAYFPEG